jgi:hypothetical protein
MESSQSSLLEQHAAALYGSVHDKLLSLPDTVEIYPAHFAGSSCGAGLSGKPSSTLAFERVWNAMLTVPRDEFIRTLAGQRVDLPAGMEDTVRFNQGRS